MIQNLTLKNFKSFRSASIPFGPISIMIGANAAGKSNLFDALRFLKAIGDGRSVRDSIEGHASPGGTTIAAAGIRGGSSAVTHFLSDNGEFELEVIIRSRGERLTYYVRIDAVRYRVIQEELCSSRHPGLYVYSTKPETGPLTQDPDSPVVVARFHKGTRGLNPRREFSPYDFILSQFTSRRAESKINEEKAEMVREEFASMRPLELRPEILRQYSPLGRFELGEHGENFAAAVWRLQQDSHRRLQRRVRHDDGSSTLETVADRQSQERWRAVCSWLSELTPRSIQSISTIAAPTGEVMFAVKEEPYSDPIPAPSLSDGTLRFAALALATIGGHGRRTLVIEEIENGINPSRMSLLIKMLEQATEAPSRQKGAGGEVQVIASTHSPSILDYASKHTIQDSIVIGWDNITMSSRPVRLPALPEFDKIAASRSMGELQAEGWLQAAADV